MSNNKNNFSYWIITSIIICTMFVAGLFMFKRGGDYFNFINFWGGKTQALANEDIVASKQSNKTVNTRVKYVNFTFKSTNIKSGDVYLKADFNLWDNSLKLIKNSKNIWEVSVALLPGEYKYYFEANGERILDPANNNIVEISDEQFCIKKVG